jgi:hypothetical protein
VTRSRIDDYITKKVRPILEAEVKKVLNNDALKNQVAVQVRDKFDGLVKSADQYSLFGYQASAIAPRQFFISGDNLVFRFR